MTIARVRLNRHRNPEFTDAECNDLNSIDILPVGKREFRGKTGYSSLVLDIERDPKELGEQIAALPNAKEIFSKLVALGGVTGTTGDELFEKAHYFYLLDQQRNYDAFNPKNAPFAFDIPSTEAEIDFQMERLRQHGIDEVKIGLELEFFLDAAQHAGGALKQFPLACFPKSDEVKAAAMADLESQWEKAQGAEKTALRTKIEAIRQFLPREVLMYDLVELDPRTRDILEPIFGTGRDGNGYYDAADILELKLKPASPKEIIKNRKLLIQVLYQKSSDYGLHHRPVPGYHQSVSYWKNGQNLLDGDTEGFDDYTPRIVAGTAKVVCEARAVAFSSLSERLINIKPDRISDIRYASGRMEGREFLAPDTMIPIILAGVAAGLDADEQFEFLPTQKIETLKVHHPSGTHKIIAHVLNGTIIDAEGNLTVPEDYIRADARKLIHELEGTEYVPSPARVPGGGGSSKEACAALIEFFSAAHVIRNGNGGKIAWPTTGDNEYVFSDNNKEVRINVAELERHITVQGYAEKYVTIGSHVSPDAPKDCEDFYIREMLQSPFLRAQLSPVFMEDLRQAWIAEFSEPAGIALPASVNTGAYAPCSP